MEKGKKQRPSLTLCIGTGMCLGLALGVAMDKLAVGMSLGFMFGVMYYLFFTNPDKKENDKDIQ